MTESSLTNFFRDVALFAICCAGVGLALHFTVPFFDFGQVLGTMLGLLGDFPRVLLLFVILGVTLVVALFVDDKIKGVR